MTLPLSILVAEVVCMIGQLLTVALGDQQYILCDPIKIL